MKGQWAAKVGSQVILCGLNFYWTFEAWYKLWMYENKCKNLQYLKAYVKYVYPV